MSKQQALQRYILKIKSGELRRAKWKLVFPIDQARRDNAIISLADSQVLRWIDELNGNTDGEALALEIRDEIKQARRDGNSAANRKRIKRLYAELDRLQYVSDYVCVIMEKEKDYHKACKGFSINGIQYERLLGTNGGIKNRTIVFVSKRLAPELKKRIENGRNPDMKLVPAKLEAYKALACSASVPVSMPRGVLVVPDCETQFLADVVRLTDEDGGEPIMEELRDESITLDASDGFGMMSPALAKRWSEELGLDYVMSCCNTRCCWEKGVAVTFDFVEFAELVAGSYIVTDAWGDDVDVRDIELVLTTSMLKLWDSYESCASYFENCAENHYTFAVTKTAPGELESVRNLN